MSDYGKFYTPPEGYLVKPPDGPWQRGDGKPLTEYDRRIIAGEDPCEVSYDISQRSWTPEERAEYLAWREKRRAEREARAEAAASATADEVLRRVVAMGVIPEGDKARQARLRIMIEENPEYAGRLMRFLDEEKEKERVAAELALAEKAQAAAAKGAGVDDARRP
jgi:hypothetical protein